MKSSSAWSYQLTDASGFKPSCLQTLSAGTGVVEVGMVVGLVVVV